MVDDDLGRGAHARRRGDAALEPVAADRRPDVQHRSGGAVLRPRRGGAAEQPALPEVDARVAQQRELLGPLDALGDDPRPDLAGEGDGGPQHGLAARVAVDAGDHAAAQLQEVGPDLGDVLERREARAGVVDRHQRALGEPRPQLRADVRDVLDRVLLGQLDHQSRRELRGHRAEAGVADRVRGDVHEQEPALRRRAGLGDRGPARDLEILAQPRAGGGGQRDVRRQRHEARRRREAGEPLVADRAQIAQVHDRLVDRADRARRQQVAEVRAAVGAGEVLPRRHHRLDRPWGGRA